MSDKTAVRVWYAKPIDRELHAKIYWRVRQAHRGVAASSSPTADEFPGMAIKSPFYADRARVIMAVNEQWRGLVGRLTGDDWKEYGYDACPISAGLIAELSRCHPEGLVFQEKIERRTCKKHMICPGCRYRLGLEIHAKLRRAIAARDVVASASFVQYFQHVDSIDLGFRRWLIRWVCSRSRPWRVDAVVAVPEWGLARSCWMLRTTIIAIATKGAEFPRLESFSDYTKRKRVPAVYGDLWRLSRATDAGLARHVAEAVSYSPNLLYSNTPIVEVERLMHLSAELRTAYHGFPRGG